MVEVVKGPEKVDKKKGKVAAVDRGQIESYGLLTADYKWIDDYLRVAEIQAEIERLNGVYAEIMRQPLNAGDMLEAVKPHFENYIARRRFILSKIFKNFDGSGDPFRFLPNMTSVEGFRIPPYLAWEEVEQIFSSIGGDVSEKEKSKQLAGIKKKIEKLQKELDSLDRPQYRGRSGDVRSRFVKHWQLIQSTCREPINPEGYDLKDSPEIERNAWKHLGLDQYVNGDGLQAR